MNPHLTYQGAQTKQDLKAILALQQANLPANISDIEAKEQGFLTVEHTLDVLTKMNTPYGHTIAKDGDTLAGYALTMTKAFRDQIPVLKPFFERIAQLHWKGEKVGHLNYVLMGQVCVAKAYRGQGVFVGLYREMQKRMAPHFELIVTEISARNTRSLRAHKKAGFVEMQRFTAPDSEHWVIVGRSTT